MGQLGPSDLDYESAEVHLKMLSENELVGEWQTFCDLCTTLPCLTKHRCLSKNDGIKENQASGLMFDIGGKPILRLHFCKSNYFNMSAKTTLSFRKKCLFSYC